MLLTVDLVREALADCDGSIRWEGTIDLSRAIDATGVASPASTRLCTTGPMGLYASGCSS